MLLLPQVRIVKHAFDIISLLTDQNPIQVLVDAIINRCAQDLDASTPRRGCHAACMHCHPLHRCPRIHAYASRQT